MTKWTRSAAACGAAVLVAGLIGMAGSAHAATAFTDNFEDGNSSGWSTSGGSWAVTTDGTHVLRQASTSASARVRAGQAAWTDYTVTARIKPTAFNGANRFAGLIARAQSSTSYYFLALRSNNTVELNKLASSAVTTLASAPMSVNAGAWYTVSLKASGMSLTGAVTGGPTLTATDGQFTSGQIGLTTDYTAANVDDVVVDTAATPNPTLSPSRSTSPRPSASASASPSVSPSGPSTSPSLPPGGDQLVGFAAVNALGQNGTTGGAGGPVVTVTTAAELIDYASRTGPYVIQVKGTIVLPTGTSDGMYHIASDKTVIGLGSNARIEHGGFTIGLPIDEAMTTVPANAVHNVIIRNLSFSGATDDAINVQMFSHHIWIDHNDLSQGGDGLVDIKRGSDYITVSWNRTHDHYKTMLLGHDDANGAQDIGRLRVTYHHNFFDGSDQRNPRVRFGESVHVYNNYCRNASYCIVSAMNAGLVVENNYFDTVNNPGRVEFSGGVGRLVARGNIVVNCHHEIETRGTVVEPGSYYSYSLDNAAAVPTLVPAGAGVGRIG